MATQRQADLVVLLIACGLDPGVETKHMIGERYFPNMCSAAFDSLGGRGFFCPTVTERSFGRCCQPGPYNFNGGYQKHTRRAPQETLISHVHDNNSLNQTSAGCNCGCRPQPAVQAVHDKNIMNQSSAG